MDSKKTISEKEAIIDNFKQAEEKRNEKLRIQLEETRTELARTEQELRKSEDDREIDHLRW